MLSIAKFIFGFDTHLAEGGNTRALVRDPETGEIIKGDDKKEQVRTFRGRPGFAEKVNLTQGRITRQQFRADVIEMLKVLDAEFKRDHGHTLWDPAQRDDILGTGFALNGSSAHLFAPPEVMPDDKFTRKKPEVGDVDLMVPEERMVELYRTLNRREDKQLTPRIAYVGHNKQSPGTDQINALFAYTWDPDAPEGEGDTFFQIDFEGSEFEEGRPTEWARFSHSSSWRDVEAGVKGLAHKMLLFSLAAVRSPPPVNARLATPSASAEKPAVSMEADPRFVPPPESEIQQRIETRAAEILASQAKKNPEKARSDAEKQVRSEIVKSSKRPKRLSAMTSIDLVSGMSPRYQKLDWTYNGEEVYKYLSRAERTGAVRDIRTIFENLLGSDPPPNAQDLEKFWSYLGMLELARERLSPQEIVKLYEIMVSKLYGPRAQKLSATDPAEDLAVKERVLEVFRQFLPDAEASTIDLEGLKRDFYSKYKVRGQEGFVEDDDQPRVDEVMMRRVRMLVETIIRGG